MFVHKRIKIGGKDIEAIATGLGGKNLIVLIGRRGYVMCGYLNLSAARRFKDTAAKVTGVSTIEQALKTTVASCTPQARRAGIYKGQPIKEALKIIA